MILDFLSRLFKLKIKQDGHSLHKESEGNNNAEAKEKVNIKKPKAMKKAKPNLPASAMLKSPASSGKGLVKKAAKKAVTKAVMKKAAKKKK